MALNAANNRGPAYSRSLLQSWLVLPAKTRLVLSLGVCFVGAAGVMVSNYLEKQYVPTQDKNVVQSDKN